MTSNLKARLLQHFINKKKEGGFTLIELLVVIIIIGILAAIALPSFLNQANRAKEAEANTNVGSINRAQQAYRLESSQFAPDFQYLDVGIGDSTTGTTSRSEYYLYTLQDTSATLAEIKAEPHTDVTLRAFLGCATADSGGKTTTKVEKSDNNTAASACP
jgi:type IV pilus assembly protein PilA